MLYFIVKNAKFTRFIVTAGRTWIVVGHLGIFVNLFKIRAGGGRYLRTYSVCAVVHYKNHSFKCAFGIDPLLLLSVVRFVSDPIAARLG